MYSSDF